MGGLLQDFPADEEGMKDKKKVVLRDVRRGEVKARSLTERSKALAVVTVDRTTS